LYNDIISLQIDLNGGGVIGRKDIYDITTNAK
jgi:hypothetical protein